MYFFNIKMNLDMIELKNETEDFLLHITKFCETPHKQIHKKPQEIHEFKLTKSREFFSFKPFFKSWSWFYLEGWFNK